MIDLLTFPFCFHFYSFNTSSPPSIKLILSFDLHISRWSTATQNSLFVIETTTLRLKCQVEAVRGNLCQLAIDTPIYGLLSSIRCLLSDPHCHWYRIAGSVDFFIFKNE